MTILTAVMGTQLEFQGALDTLEAVDEDYCDLYDQYPYLIAIRLCIAPNRYESGSYFAGK